MPTPSRAGHTEGRCPPDRCYRTSNGDLSMRVAWTADIHLELLDKGPLSEYLDFLADQMLDVLLIAGDIGTAKTVASYLALLARSLHVPTYFCLGNHDIYGGSISAVRAAVRQTAAGIRCLNWLPEAGAAGLSDSVAVVGHGSWGDGRFGAYGNSPVRLRDFSQIKDFVLLDQEQRLSRMQEVADEASDHFRRTLPRALDMAQHVIVVTHVPPFAEAAWHDGEQSGPFWLPFFACKVVGDVLREAMESYPDSRMTVLCGHTHGGGVVQIMPNLKVLTGRSEYGLPGINGVFDL